MDKCEEEEFVKYIIDRLTDIECCPKCGSKNFEWERTQHEYAEFTLPCRKIDKTNIGMECETVYIYCCGCGKEF